MFEDTDDKVTARFKLVLALIIMEFFILTIVFIIPVWLLKWSALTMAVPLIGCSMMAGILFGAKYQRITSYDGSGRGHSSALVHGIWIFLVIGALLFTIFAKVLSHDIIVLPSQVMVIVLLVPFMVIIGLMVYYQVLTEGWE